MTIFSERRLRDVKANGAAHICCALLFLSGFADCCIAIWLSRRDMHETKPDHENCPSYNLAAFILIEIAKFLNEYGVALTAVATVAIALFTWTLWQSNEKMWTVTKISAEAARDSADAAIATERARFYIIVDKHNLQRIVKIVEDCGVSENSGLPGGENILISYRFKNYGKTPGIIRELIVDSTIASDPIDPPALFLSTKDFPEYMIGAGDSTKAANYSPIIHPSISQAQSIGRNARRLWFFGRLYYDDVFGKHQVHRFYFRSKSPIGGGDSVILEPVEYKDYNQST